MTPTAIVDEWFGTLTPEGKATQEKSARWWKKDPEFDAYLKSTYGEWVERALAGELDEWRKEPLSALALILLLDQFTRNIYRNSAQMYAGDERAVSVAKELISNPAALETLPEMFRCFVYMPLMHSEQLEDQDACVAHFKALADNAPKELSKVFENNHDYALKHRDIVARFGRFPHRNEILSRPTTPEELEFLKQPGSSF